MRYQFDHLDRNVTFTITIISFHPGTERIVQRELDCDGQHGDDQVPRRDGRRFAGLVHGGGAC